MGQARLLKVGGQTGEVQRAGRDEQAGERRWATNRPLQPGAVLVDKRSPLRSGSRLRQNSEYVGPLSGGHRALHQREPPKRTFPL